MELMERIEKKRARVGVIGLGYVGLPLGVEFSRAGFAVTGFEVDGRRVAELNAGRSYIGDVSEYTIRELVASKRLRATTDFDELAQMDTISICVPTPLRKTRDPDLTYIISALDQILPRLRAGQLIVLESTTYPGTTEELVQPKLEEGGLAREDAQRFAATLVAASEGAVVLARAEQSLEPFDLVAEQLLDQVRQLSDSSSAARS